MIIERTINGKDFKFDPATAPEMLCKQIAKACAAEIKKLKIDIVEDEVLDTTPDSYGDHRTKSSKSYSYDKIEALTRLQMLAETNFYKTYKCLTTLDGRPCNSWTGQNRWGYYLAVKLEDGVHFFNKVERDSDKLACYGFLWGTAQRKTYMTNRENTTAWFYFPLSDDATDGITKDMIPSKEEAKEYRNLIKKLNGSRKALADNADALEALKADFGVNAVYSAIALMLDTKHRDLLSEEAIESAEPVVEILKSMLVEKKKVRKKRA